MWCKITSSWHRCTFNNKGGNHSFFRQVTNTVMHPTTTTTKIENIDKDSEFWMKTAASCLWEHLSTHLKPKCSKVLSSICKWFRMNLVHKEHYLALFMHIYGDNGNYHYYFDIDLRIILHIYSILWFLLRWHPYPHQKLFIKFYNNHDHHEFHQWM